ncbi:hypothetical protein KIM372_14960 [Bombiscardovia nodaiensis]|uniref:Sortase n=1 Tax=Bombiscardovia nodaiensis TaxID=2932181 RepID=A0ABN6SD84_9BIFI|nr:hypothetical protein KIM372_14960 [Bombiscardovia nodaiensis]
MPKQVGRGNPSPVGREPASDQAVGAVGQGSPSERFPSFEVVLAGGSQSAESRQSDRIDFLLKCSILLCFALSLAVVAWIPVVQYVHQEQETRALNEAEAQIANWPRERLSREFAAAQAYNQELAASKQAELGESVDPFLPGEQASSSRSDQRYRSLLNMGEGIMGSVEIPKVSIRLPVYHGTRDDVLVKGVGHLYGTSLPVGGPSTNAVVSGHRGLVGSLLFTRLDELETGDLVYMHTLGRTLAYRVQSVEVINPDDTHLYRIVPGSDLLTLMTCTPYGVNTRRLVIRAERDRGAEKSTYLVMQQDALLQALRVGLLVALLGGLLLLLRPRQIYPCHDSGLRTDADGLRRPHRR